MRVTIAGGNIFDDIIRVSFIGIPSIARFYIEFIEIGTVLHDELNSHFWG